MWGFFTVSLVAVAAAIALLLRRYAAPSVPAVVKAATAYAWLVAFVVVVLVPMDVFSTLVGRQDNRVVDVMWQVCYWSTQALTWLALPFFQVYADAGDFTVGARCWTSIKVRSVAVAVYARVCARARGSGSVAALAAVGQLCRTGLKSRRRDRHSLTLQENGVLYGAAAAAGVVGLVCIVVVERSLRLSDLVALALGLSNTFALSVGLLLLGYGLVEIPRETYKGRPEQLLKWYAHRTGRFAGGVLRATRELETVVTITVANERQMPRRDPLRPYMEVIAAAAERDSPVTPSQVCSVCWEGAGACSGAAVFVAAVVRWAPRHRHSPSYIHLGAALHTYSKRTTNERHRSPRAATSTSTASPPRTSSTIMISRASPRCAAASPPRSTATRARTRSTPTPSRRRSRCRTW